VTALEDGQRAMRDELADLHTRVERLEAPKN
jgi:hypothetical protein